MAISSFRVIASETWQFHSFVSLRVKRGNLIKKEQNSLCAKRARTEGTVFRRNDEDNINKVSTFGKKERNIKIFLSTRVDRFEGIGLMN